MSVGSYYNSDKIALRMSRARPADPTEYARYHNLVEGAVHRERAPQAAPVR
ncbi:MAG: hypothetical protein KatS3mg010_0654 [Acidimicrobiia bacterium]|nr:MAG: hypothetical protein KatS3mg010_0654 [Acidimicrobiia bacterium]